MRKTANPRSGISGSDLFESLRQAFVSPNEHDANFEAANVVDGLFLIGRAVYRLAEAGDAIATGLRMISDAIDQHGSEPR